MFLVYKEIHSASVLIMVLLTRLGRSCAAADSEPASIIRVKKLLTKALLVIRATNLTSCSARLSAGNLRVETQCQCRSCCSLRPRPGKRPPLRRREASSEL